MSNSCRRDADKKQDEKVETPQNGTVLDPHGPDAELFGSALFFRKLGPETPELRLIVCELMKLRNKRDTRKLTALRRLVLNRLKSKELHRLVALANDPRSFADLMSEYDPGVRFLRSEILPDLFELFRKKRGAPKSDARVAIETYVSTNEPELRDILRSRGLPAAARTVQKACDGSSYRMARRVLDEWFRISAPKKHSPKRPSAKR